MDDLMKTLWSIAGNAKFCACGAPEWNGTGRCEEHWTEDEQGEPEHEPEDVYYNICDR